MKSCLFALLVVASAVQAQAAQTVVIVFDDSGSMNTNLRSGGMTRMDAAKKALTGVIQQLPADTNLGLVRLNSNWSPDQWTIPLGPLNKPFALQKVGELGPNGGTPLGGCMKAGTDGLLAFREKQHYGTFRLLVVTDGEAGDSNLVEAYLPDILSRGIVVDAIGVDMADDHSLATKVHHYRRGDDPNSLEQAIAATFAETSANDGALEDFAILSAIPEGAAGAYLKALAVNDNKAIGEKKTVPVLSGDGIIQLDKDGNPVLVQEPVPMGNGMKVLMAFGIVIASVFGLLMLAAFIKALS